MTHPPKLDTLQLKNLTETEQIKLSITKTQLEKDRKVATTVLLELQYQLSRQTSSIKVK